MAFSLMRNGLRSTSRILERNFAGCTSILVATNEDKVVKTVTPRSTNFVQISSLTIKPIIITSREYSKKSKHERDYESDSDSSDDELDNHRQQHQSHLHDKTKHGGKHLERGNSEFWRRKMRTLHSLLDVNNDGVISYDDFNLLANKFAVVGNLQPSLLDEFHQVMKETWEHQWGEITPYNLVTAEQFLTDMHHALNDKELVKKMYRFLPYFFKAVDIDHSGYLDLDQYKLFFRCLGLTDEDAAVSFAVIDKNGDGKLTLKEFVKLGKDFFLTEDERRISRMFWGPLIEH